VQQLALQRYVVRSMIRCLTPTTAEAHAVSDYETDTLLWSERQADLLRRLAAGEHVNEQVDGRT
jgi:hypothetical protein